MLKMDYGDGYRSNWVRLCDTCRVSASTLYCHTDSAFLCSSCDEQIHAVGSPCWPHHRVIICGACENAPAAFTCKADDASLCINCDFEIHSANTIASRHNRVPVSPLSHVLHENITTEDRPSYEVVGNNKSSKEMDEREADSWLLLDSETVNSKADDGFMFGEAEGDHRGRVGVVVECDSSSKFQNFQDDQDQEQQDYSFSNENDSVVPIQSVEAQPQQLQQQQQNIYFNMEHDPPRMAITNYPSNCRSVGVPYMDAHVLQMGTMFANPSVSLQIQFGQMSRKAGVEKYREKKKSRKFEKRIRYAYRKAYAEKRPRVKGRFAKREDLNSEGSLPLN